MKNLAFDLPDDAFGQLTGCLQAIAHRNATPVITGQIQPGKLPFQLLKCGNMSRIGKIVLRNGLVPVPLSGEYRGLVNIHDFFQTLSAYGLPTPVDW